MIWNAFKVWLDQLIPWLMLTMGTLFLLMVWTPTRTLIQGAASTFLIPAFLGLMRQIGLWTIWLMKKLLLDHLLIIKNLIKPKKDIFPSLENEKDVKH